MNKFDKDKISSALATILKAGQWLGNISESIRIVNEALSQYMNTGLTPEQIVEIDRLYEQKCLEVAELEKKHGLARQWRFCEDELPHVSEESYIILVKMPYAEQPYIHMSRYTSKGWEISAPVIAWMPPPTVPLLRE